MKRFTADFVQRSKILHWLRYLVYLLIAIFLFSSLANGWEQVRQFDWNFSLWRLLLAFLLQAAYFLSHGLLWVWMIRRLNIALPYARGLPIFAMSRLSKYIPGGVWPFASVAAFGRQEGYSTVRMTASLLLTTLLSLWVSALFALPIFPFVNTNIDTSLNCLIGALLASAVLFAPWLLRWVFLWIAKWQDLPQTKALQSLVVIRRIVFVFLAFTVLHLLQLSSFYLFLTSIIDISISDGIYSALSWSAAWLIGFLVLIVPSGLGVREASLTMLLERVMPLSIATAVGVGHRLFLTVFDLMILIIYVVVTYFTVKQPAEPI